MTKIAIANCKTDGESLKNALKLRQMTARVLKLLA